MSRLGSSAPANLEILVVLLKEQEFGLRTHSIREIRGWAPVTPMPNSPSEVLGISNLRGTAIPIIDLSTKLGMGRVSVSERSAIVVVELNDMIVGLLVDGVSGMMTQPVAALQPLPPAAATYTDYSDGIIPHENALICYLNLEKIFPKEMAAAEYEF